jgi:hypothetical protein
MHEAYRFFGRICVATDLPDATGAARRQLRDPCSLSMAPANLRPNARCSHMTGRSRSWRPSFPHAAFALQLRSHAHEAVEATGTSEEAFDNAQSRNDPDRKAVRRLPLKSRRSAHMTVCPFT